MAAAPPSPPPPHRRLVGDALSNSAPRRSSSASDIFAMPAKLRNLVQSTRLDIKIGLHDRKKTYTTLDRLEGTVSITASADTPFDAIDIDFVGTSRTYVERLTTAAAVSGRAEAFHQFLKLQQPDLHRHYPHDAVLRAGTTYNFPYLFVVPQHLILRICQHKVENALVRDAHLHLPPTFGDKDLPNQLDDMAPEMASVRYGVFARVSKVKLTGDDASTVTLASKARKLRVVPAVEEHPPLAVDGDDGDYCLRKEKTLRKGMLKGKLGTLVIEAKQPPALRLQPHAASTDTLLNTSATSMATIMLRFDPADANAPPPRLGSLSSKLKVSTYFASTARVAFPAKAASALDLSQGLHQETLALSSRCMANVEWTAHCPSAAKSVPTPSPNNTTTTTTTTTMPKVERRDSACSVTTPADCPAPSANYKNSTYYTARLLVPLTLPTTKSFVPTFHSCLITRTYALRLDLSLAGTLTGMSGSGLDLRVPIQISSSAAATTPTSEDHRDSVDSDGFEIDLAGQEGVRGFFEPRTIRAPSEGFVGRSRIGSQAPIAQSPPANAGAGAGWGAPPGYEEFNPRASI